MSFPTLTEIYDKTRSECGDTEVAGGQIYTNALLLPHIQAACRELWRGMRTLAVPRVSRTFYYTLPANTSVFYPSTALITDFSEPSGPVSVRGSLTSIGVAAATQASGFLDITCTGIHGLSTGAVVVLQQLGGLNGANVACTVTASSASQLFANGLVTTGTYTSGGNVVTSQNEFGPLPWASALPATTQAVDGISSVVYQDGFFQFMPSTTEQQIRVPYWSSAAVPTTGTDTVAVNDCIDFLSQFAGSKACKAQGANDRAASLWEEAVGPAYTSGVIGGSLRQLLVTAVRQIQNRDPYDRGPRPFRPQMDNYGYI
ncbi:MAG: hypothetical protein EBR82_07255 [Caulobacteraceae bacterium]|nr:hypothetical protein [Caulobacteraceae bacterium]